MDKEAFQPIVEKKETVQAPVAKKTQKERRETRDPLATGLADWDLEPPMVVVRKKARRQNR